MTALPAHDAGRVVSGQRTVTGNLNVGTVTTDAPARGLFFLLLFLWTSKEKVDPKKTFFETFLECGQERNSIHAGEYGRIKIFPDDFNRAIFAAH